MPLGEKLWEEKSKAVVRRIMDVSEKGVHAETTFTGEIQGFGRGFALDGEYFKRLPEEIVRLLPPGAARSPGSLPESC
jgi:hypothetical protein